MPPKGARKFGGEPAPRTKAAALARFVNFGVGAADQPFQIAPQFAFGSERRNLSQIRRGALIQDVETLQLLNRHLAGGIAIQPVERFFERGPVRALGFDEAGKVENHNNCLCLTSS